MGDQSSKKTHEEVLPNCFLPRQSIKGTFLLALFNGDLPSNTKSQPNQIKKTHANQLIRQISQFPGETRQTQIICTYSHIFLTILSSTSCSFECTLLYLQLSCCNVCCEASIQTHSRHTHCPSKQGFWFFTKSDGACPCSLDARTNDSQHSLLDMISMFCQRNRPS